MRYFDEESTLPSPDLSEKLKNDFEDVLDETNIEQSSVNVLPQAETQQLTAVS